MAIIEVDHVTKEFQLGQLRSLKTTMLNQFRKLAGKPVEERAPFKALDDVSFSIEQGEVIGIIGHNGAGKSTLLKLLANISTPTRGRVSVKGKVAPLIEVGAGLVGDLTGRENVYLNGSILGISKAEIKRKFDDIVGFAELEEFIDTPIKRYSSGMQVRLGFAIATSVDSDILIVDEVLAVGDLAFQRKCFDRMEALIKSEIRTVLVVGHNIRQLERLSSRMLLLDGGRVLMDARPDEVCRHYFSMTADKVERQHTATGMSVVSGQVESGEIAVGSIEFFADDSAVPTETIELHGAMRIRVQFQSNAALGPTEIVIGFHTSDFVYIASASSALRSMNPDLPLGPHVFDCCLSDVNLRPGAYNFRLAFLDRYRRMMWYGEGLKPFHVIAQRTNAARIPDLGLVDLTVDWEFSDLDIMAARK